MRRAKSRKGKRITIRDGREKWIQRETEKVNDAQQWMMHINRKSILTKIFLSLYFCRNETATKHVSKAHRTTSEPSDSSFLVEHRRIQECLYQSLIEDHQRLLRKISIIVQGMQWCSFRNYSSIYCYIVITIRTLVEHFSDTAFHEKKSANTPPWFSNRRWLKNI